MTANVPLLPMGIALDRHFVASRPLNQFGVQERMRWFWPGAYEVTMGQALKFDHLADDREAVKRSTDMLMQAIKRLVNHSAQRLLNSSWPAECGAGMTWPLDQDRNTSGDEGVFSTLAYNKPEDTIT